MLDSIQRWLGSPTRKLAFTDNDPNLDAPTWQMCTAAQFADPAYVAIAEALHFSPARTHRKLWEFAYIVRVLDRLIGDLSGKRALGFGVGKEPLVAYFAASGANVVATDLDAASARAAGWVSTDQHAATLEHLQFPEICAPNRLRANATFRAVDMNDIPDDLCGFDFLWSSCSLEHLGSLESGLQFVERAMHCLRPDGIAVHTTEFNVNSDDATVEHPDLSIYRRRDIVGLASRLARAGHWIPMLNFEPGDTVQDQYVDTPPYRDDFHLKLEFAGHVTTSFGLFARRNGRTWAETIGRSRHERPTPATAAAAEQPPYSIAHYLVHNSARCEKLDTGCLRIVTPVQPWSYAVELPLQDSLDRRGLTVTIRARVQCNSVRCGILAADGRKFIQEVEIGESTIGESVELVAAADTSAGSLMVRSAARGSGTVDFEIIRCE